jgi:peptidase C25-like protein
VFLPTCALLLPLLVQAKSLEVPSERVAVLVPIAAQASWLDDAFLAAVPAAATLGNGEPIVLAVNQDDPWRPELLDFLHRFQPQRLLWVGPKADAVPADWENLLEWVPATNALEAAVGLAALTWSNIDQVVLFDPQDRAAALAASACAARLRQPLLPSHGGEISADLLALIQSLDCEQALFVGAAKTPRKKGLSIEGLHDAEAVLQWMVKHRMKVEYLAVVNPLEEVAGRDRHLTLAAPLLAAGRSGAVVPLSYQTHWKQRIDAETVVPTPPAGTAHSDSGWRQGSLPDSLGETSFLIGNSPATGRWLQLDRNGDGKFSGATEQPLATAAEIELAGQSWSINLDAEEKSRGQALWLTTPTATQIQSDLAPFRAACRKQARYLCLIGWPESLPMAIIANGQGIDADLVSDLPYAQTDADPFIELGFARFIAEDLPSATLLACRGLARDDFPVQDWAKSFATAEWSGACEGLLQSAGLQFAGHHDGGQPFASTSPLAEVGLIVHGSHAAWTVLGKTYAWNTSTLLAPALVESAGCSTASLDQDPQQRSVAARLLRNGAVAFVGNTRRGVAQQSLYRSEFMNALLTGSTFGDAQRAALNRVTLAVLERPDENGGLYYYQLYNQAAYGDPALPLGLAQNTAERAAQITQKGSRVRVLAPAQWHRYEYTPLAEWGCPFPQLYTWRGAGIGVESTWYNPQKRNQDDLYFTVEARTKKHYNAVEQTSKTPESLNWKGRCFVDEHADGSRSLWWRVRLLDYDMTKGEVHSELEHIDFRLKKE